MDILVLEDPFKLQDVTMRLFSDEVAVLRIWSIYGIGVEPGLRLNNMSQGETQQILEDVQPRPHFCVQTSHINSNSNAEVTL